MLLKTGSRLRFSWFELDELVMLEIGRQNSLVATNRWIDDLSLLLKSVAHIKITFF